MESSKLKDTEIIIKSTDTKFIFDIKPVLKKIKHLDDKVEVEIGIENKYINYHSTDFFFNKGELLNLINRIKNIFFYKYSEETIDFLNADFKILAQGIDEEQYMEILLYFKGTGDYICISLNYPDIINFVKMVDLQTKK